MLCLYLIFHQPPSTQMQTAQGQTRSRCLFTTTSPSSQSLPRMLDEWMEMKNVCPEVRGQDLDHHLSWLPGLPQWAPRAPTSSPLTLYDPTLPQFCPHSRCYPSPSISPKVHFQALGLPRDVLGRTSPCHPDLPSQLGLLLSLPEAA